MAMGERGSGPAIVLNMRAVSCTVRSIGPCPEAALAFVASMMVG